MAEGLFRSAIEKFQLNKYCETDPRYVVLHHLLQCRHGHCCQSRLRAHASVAFLRFNAAKMGKARTRRFVLMINFSFSLIIMHSLYCRCL